MMKFRKFFTNGWIVLSLWILAACSPEPSAPTPTIDLDPLRTEVASTVLAQVTQTICPVPSITPTPSPTVTAISIVTLTSTRSVVASPVLTGTLVTGTPPAGTPVPVLDDEAQWVSQTILDGTIFTPGEAFTMTWTLENVGASTWTAGYLLRFYSGNTFGALEEIPLGRDVPPGQTVEITVLMKAPTQTGDFRSDWVMSNQNRLNFKEPIFLKITVANPTPTPTRTPSPTPSPTAGS